MLLMVFQTAQNVALSQVHGACVSHAIFFYSLIYSKTRKTIEKNGMRDTGSMHLWQGNVLRSLEYHQQHAHRRFYNRVWMPKSENIRGRDSRWTKYSNPATHTMLNPCTPKAQCFSACVSKKWCWGFDFFRPLGLMPPRLHQHWTLGARGVFQIERVLIFRPSTVYHSINKPTSLSFGRLAPACNLFLSKMNHWDGSRCVGQVLVKPHWVTRCDFFFRYADYAEITRFISQIAVFIGQFPSIALVKFFSSLFCVLFSRLGFFPHLPGEGC